MLLLAAARCDRVTGKLRYCLFDLGLDQLSLHSRLR